MALRWGIVSAGLISSDFVSALDTLPSDEHSVVAIAARDIDRAGDFAKKFNIPKAYGTYLELARCPDVEVVYVGAVNPQHFELSRLMLENGKHVLVEKPLCMNRKQAKELILIAERKRLFLMEAIWSRCFPSYKYLEQQIKHGKLGDIKSIDVEFGIELSHVERLSKKDLGGGTVLDLGVYVIQFAQFVLRQQPKSIEATGKLNEEGIDTEVQVKINYSDDVIANLSTSALRKLSNKAVIKGTKGQITLDNFWCPESLVDIDGQEKTWPLPQAKHSFNFYNSCGLRYEADEVRKCIRDGKTESEVIGHNESLTIAGIQDEIRRQIGVVFLEDN